MSHAAAYLDSVAIERQRRLDGRVAPDPHAHVMWSRALARARSNTDRLLLEAAHDFALRIPYRHKGLASDIYVAHPLRVAAMAILSYEDAGAETGVVGLLHNVLEVSDVDEAELRIRFGDSVCRQVASLTVDRSRQWDDRYKRVYYAAISKGPRPARVVKVMDKLDNLFLLHLTPDAETKNRYAREIATFVLPIARRDVPDVASYLSDVLNEEVRRSNLDVPLVEPFGR